MKILIGTNNPGKLETYHRAFAMQQMDVDLVTLAQAGITDEPEENEATLLENAKMKAQYYAEQSGLVTIADDTGLFVDTLNGEPGMHAARWHQGTPQEKCQALLNRLEGIPMEKRTARFIGVVVCFDPKQKLFWDFEGRIEGWISDDFRGESGFGYDPIFLTKQFDKHMAELTDEEFAQIGYREQAVAKLMQDKFLSFKKL